MVFFEMAEAAAVVRLVAFIASLLDPGANAEQTGYTKQETNVATPVRQGSWRGHTLHHSRSLTSSSCLLGSNMKSSSTLRQVKEEDSDDPQTA